MRNWLSHVVAWRQTNQTSQTNQTNQSAKLVASHKGSETLPANAATLRRVPRLLAKGAMVALLLTILGGVAATRGPVAHAEPIGHYTSQIGYDKKPLFGASGYLEARLYAKYYTDGSYSGETWSEAHVYLAPHGPWGTLGASLWDASGHSMRNASESVNGGNTIGQNYYMSTPHIYLTHGHAEASFSFTSGNATYGTIARTPDIWV